VKKVLIGIIFALVFFFPFEDVEAASISDGVYKIQSSLDEGRVINIEGNRNVNGANINLANFDDTNNQKWYVTNLGNGYYSITSLLDGNRSLDVYGAGKAWGTNLNLFGYNGTNAQQWLLEDAGNGYYRIKSRCNGLYVDVYGGIPDNGANLQMFVGNGTNAQKFKFTELITGGTKTLEDGYYTFADSKNNNMVLDIAAGNTANNTNIQLFSSNKSYAQIWKVKYLDNGFYSITSASDENKSLDVAAAGKSNNTNIQLFVHNNSSAQQWLIKDVGDGNYTIISRCNGLVIDVAGGIMSNNTNIQMFVSNNSAAQKFKAKKIDLHILKDGLYTIGSKIDNSKVIGLNRELAINNSNVRIETDNNMNDQKWYIRYLGAGYYSIRSAINSNMVMDVAAAGTKAGTNVQLFVSNNSDAQKWFLTYNDDGTYTIAAKHSGLVLDVAGGVADNGTNITTFTSNKTDAQKFVFQDTTLSSSTRSYDDGYYVISSALDGSKVLDVAGGVKKNNTNIQLFGSNNSIAQIWKIKYLNNGYYSVTSAMNYKISMDVAGGNMDEGANLQLFIANNSDSQQWYFKDLGNDYVSIISKKNGLALDVQNGSSANGTNVRLMQSTDGNNQKFKLTKYTNKKTYMGIDVSHHQKNIDWETIANSNIGFVIIRAGYGDYYADNPQDDAYFRANVAACEKYNIPYGIYFYSYAVSPSGAEHSGLTEARHLLRLTKWLEDSGYKPTLGTKVFYDVEDKTQAHLSNLTEIADKFCSVVESNSYSCGIYASKEWLESKLNAPYLASKYDIWVAQWPYGHNPTSYDEITSQHMSSSYTRTGYKYWQFTSSGSVDGIVGNVDLDFGYDIFD